MAGYSGKPLLQKLGATADGRSLLLFFATRRAVLTRQFTRLAGAVYPDGALWIAWPKTASGVTTDVTERIVREAGLRQGLVDVKVAALDEIWSGLKFVYRLKDRSPSRRVHRGERLAVP
ncbi:MAG TPA: DUF3052 domain-containing protein [bacterium]|nr:DUF3052 domain-containing protein [bacterium]